MKKKEKKTSFCLTCSYFRILHAFGSKFFKSEKIIDL